MFYRGPPSTGSTTHYFRARCVLETSAEKLICITREFDLCKEWNKYCEVSEIVKEYSFADLCVFCTLWMPL